MKYLMQNYHILGILVIVTIIAVKLFMTTRKAREMLARVEKSPKLDDIVARLDRIEKTLSAINGSKPKA